MHYRDRPVQVKPPRHARVRVGFRRLVLDGIPIDVPVIAVEGTAERCHAVDAADSPAGAGLFEAAADQILRKK